MRIALWTFLRIGFDELFGITIFVSGKIWITNQL